MRWHIRLAATDEGLDLAGLRSLAALVDGVPLCMGGDLVGHVREPWIIGRELFAVAEIAAAPFAAQLEAWERRGRLATAAGLWIEGRTAPAKLTECEPSAVYVAVASVDVVTLPRGAGCFLWSDEVAASGEGVLPGVGAATARPWRPRPARGEDSLGDLRRRGARGAR
jgi:hypothetical protein